MEISICILNWNTAAHLRRCLSSIVGATGRSPLHEIIVVDNASTDGSADMVRREFPQARLIANNQNRGFAAGHNQGIAASSGRYILLLNADTIVHASALETLVATMDALPRAAVAGPRLLNADGSLQFSCRRFPRFATGLFRKVPLGRLLPDNVFNSDYLMRSWDHSEMRQVDWVSGAAFFLRREAVREIGLLDEGYFMYCEDVDWCYRAKRAGWQVWYIPQAVVTHLHGRSTDQRPFAMSYQFHRSMIRFYRKHYAPAWPGFLRWLPEMCIWLRLAVVIAEHGIQSWRNIIRRRT
jgi:hypothetical protein